MKNMNYKKKNEQDEIKCYKNNHIHPPSILSRLISDEQNLRTTFLEGREDDKTIPRTSTFTLNSKHPFKVKAKLDSKSFWFPPRN